MSRMPVTSRFHGTSGSACWDSPPAWPGTDFRFGDALSLNAALVESMRQRHASLLAIASTRFDDYFALARLHRVREARELILSCRQVFEREGDYAMLAWAMHALADLEEEEGRPPQAVRLAEDALRLMYRESAGAPSARSISPGAQQPRDLPPLGLRRRGRQPRAPCRERADRDIRPDPATFVHPRLR